MVSFALAHELKAAGLTQSTHRNAEYFLNEHFLINREDAVRMRYANKGKRDWEFRIAEDLVYCPMLSELIEGCGLPLALSSDPRGHWTATSSMLDEPATREGATPEEAVARLWLLRHKNI
jgi:hypothetical protein